jgi:hypothetical protein
MKQHTSTRFGSRTMVSLIAASALLAGAHSYGAASEKPKDEKSTASEADARKKLVDAQRRLDDAAREVADLSMQLSGDGMTRMYTLGRSQRALLGINLGGERRSEDGVEVASVSPGGPAADAGLKGGDLLLELNGKSLKRDGETWPREKLLALMRDVEPGAKVNVSYRRENKVAKATLTAQSATDWMRSFRFEHGLADGGPEKVTRQFAFMHTDGMFGSAELAPLTPKLGEYFGTEKGLLVVRAPSDSRLQLEDGDVILDIDGRVPANPSHALRILGSYQSGEKLKLNVMRAKKRVAFEVTIPEEGPNVRFKKSRVFLPGAPVPVPPEPPMPPEAGIQLRTLPVPGDGPWTIELPDGPV